MDKRYKQLTKIEQYNKRINLANTISAHPEWQIKDIVQFLRNELVLTLPEFANICKVAVKTLQLIESGDGNPTLNTVERILKPFGFRIAVLPTI